MQDNVAQYWRKTKMVTALLLLIWFLATFVLTWFAVPLSKINFFGWPFSFYMAAQGCQIIYLGLIIFYAWKMEKLDKEFGFDEGDNK